MTQPKLSLCIPTYNRAGLLRQTLESLRFLNDAGFPVEIVVSDNASTDETPAVVQDAAGWLPNVRYYRQDSTVGLVPNHISVFRMARGEYATFLADDDRLVPDGLFEVVSYLDKNRDVVACFTGWYEWDDTAGTPMGTFNRFDRLTKFTKADTGDLFNFVINYHVFPEIGIYRTPMLHRVWFGAHKIWDFHWWMCKFLEHGSICFHPVIFYKNRLVFEGGRKNTGRSGDRLAVNIMDAYRGAAESVLFHALRQRGAQTIDDGQRAKALEMINEFTRGRMAVAAKLARNQGDYIASVEYFIRFLVWSRVRPEEIDYVEREIVPLAAAQAIVETLEQTTDMDRLCLCGFDRPDDVAARFRTVRQGLTLSEGTLDDAADAPDRDMTLFVVDQPAEREALVAAGLESGRVLSYAEACDYFSIRSGGASPHDAHRPATVTLQ